MANIEKFTFSSIVKAVKLYGGADDVAISVPAVLEWDQFNRHDRYAVSVFARCRGRRKMAGHLTKDDAAKLGPYLPRGTLEAEG